MGNGDGQRMCENLTQEDHWENCWSSSISMRLPSPFHVNNRNIQRLLKRHVGPGKKILEIGCAPGKTLAWIASLGICEVAGLDYSQKGISNCQALFKALQLEGDLRCEDAFSTSFAQDSFDLVYSFGVIEHFTDSREIIFRHLLLARPGGKVLMVIPNFGGVQGRLFKRLAPDAAAMHNLTMMSVNALLLLVPTDQVNFAKAYPEGRISPWHWGL